MKKKRRETITLIWFRNRTGVTHSVEVSTRKVIVVSAAILLFSVLSVSMALNFYLRSSMLLEELNAIKEGRALETKPLNAEVSPAQGKTVMALKEGDKPLDKGGMGGGERKVSIENVEVAGQGEEGTTKASLEIVRRESAGEKLSGFVIMVGRSGDAYFTLPEGIDVKDGTPVNYKDGDRYVIKYRKRFEKIIPYQVGSIDLLYAYVYGEDGRLLLKQGIKIR